MDSNIFPSKGCLFVVSGASGAGKTTLIRKAIEELGLFFSVSVTTRKPRVGELEGRDYHFIPLVEFQNMKQKGQLLEWAQVHDYFYGTLSQPIFEKLNQGQSVLLDLDSQGALQIKLNFPEAVLIFIMPPALEDLRHRLESRGTDSSEEIEKRLQKAQHEIAQNRHYDYIVVNEEVDSAYQELRQVIIESSRGDSI